MRVLDQFRLRQRASGGLARTAWDAGDAGDLAALVTTLAAAWDSEPGDPRAAASRAAVLGRFATVSAAGASTAGRASARALASARAKPGIGRSGPRPALVLVSAGLLLAMAIGTAAASAPGGPLYGLRVTSEELLLPAAPAERLRAQVSRLDGRLAEASGAAMRGDSGAVIASLRAYAQIAAAAAAGQPADAATVGQLVVRVRAQLELLSTIGAGDAALQAVRTQAELAVRALLGALGEPEDGPGPGSGPSGSGDPSWNGPPPTRSQAPGTQGAPGTQARPALRRFQPGPGRRRPLRRPPGAGGRRPRLARLGRPVPPDRRRTPRRPPLRRPAGMAARPRRRAPEVPVPDPPRMGVPPLRSPAADPARAVVAPSPPRRPAATPELTSRNGRDLQATTRQGVNARTDSPPRDPSPPGPAGRSRCARLRPVHSPLRRSRHAPRQSP